MENVLCLQESFVPNGGFECLQDSLLLKQLAGLSQIARAPADTDSTELDSSSGK